MTDRQHERKPAPHVRGLSPFLPEDLGGCGDAGALAGSVEDEGDGLADLADNGRPNVATDLFDPSCRDRPNMLTLCCRNLPESVAVVGFDSDL